MATVAEALARAAHQLAAAGSDAPSLEARVLLGNVLGCSRAWLYQNPRCPLAAEQAERLGRLIDQRRQGVPLAYLVGIQEFYGRAFVVDERVLVPRPETELLVEKAIAMLRGVAEPRVVDVGTGSGVIAISIALEVPAARVLAIDLSAQALEVAQINRGRFGVADRVQLVQGDLLASVSEAPDLIVANLPYVARSEIDRLQPEVRREPRCALDGGLDGLDLYRRLFAQVSERWPGCRAILIEIGDTQGVAAARLARYWFPDHRIQVIPDLAGRDRLLAVTTAGEEPTW